MDGLSKSNYAAARRRCRGRRRFSSCVAAEAANTPFIAVVPACISTGRVRGCTRLRMTSKCDW